MRKLFLIAFFIAIVLGRTYPMYKQYDPKWGLDKMGTSTSIIASKGCVISSVSMALSAIGKSYNPGTLNKWLTNNKGYINGNTFVWNSVDTLGLKFEGKFGNSKIKDALKSDKVVIVNVRNKTHWVLATGYTNDIISVNDPGYSLSSYKLSEIADGNTVLYKVG